MSADRDETVAVNAQDFEDIMYRVREGGMRDDWRDDVLMRLQHALDNQPKHALSGEAYSRLLLMFGEIAQHKRVPTIEEMEKAIHGN